VENLAHGFSRKIKADVFIDDRNLGGIPDWGTIYQMIHNRKAHQPWDIGENDYHEHAERIKRPGFFDHLLGRK
jgi:hypothetical protein